MDREFLGGGEIIWRMVSLEYTYTSNEQRMNNRMKEVARTLDIPNRPPAIRLSIHPRECVHHECLDMLLQRIRRGGDAQFRDRDILVEGIMSGLDSFLNA
jgi:hypothetical protein